MQEEKNAWTRVMVPVSTTGGYVYKMEHRCPVCKWQQGTYTNYCPNCGLRLVEVE